MAETKPAVVDADIGIQLIPAQASDYAAHIDHLYFALLGLSGLLITILVGLICVFAWRYHDGRPERRGAPVSERASKRVEIAFACVLAVLFAGTFYWGSDLYLMLYDNPRADLTINIIGKQWMWQLQHPDGTREINTLHLPVGETIELRLTSQDVIHSFSVPALRLKRDAVPGMYTTVYFKASKTGEFQLFCAEYCGQSHSRMRGRVMLMEPEDYQQWLAGNGDGEGPAVAGKALFESYGCSGCHLGKSAVRAPALDGLYGRVVPLANGKTKVADEAYIRDSIVEPQKDVVAGYQPIMPSFAGQISESEIFEIIAYIKSLKPGDWQQDNPTGTGP